MARQIPTPTVITNYNRHPELGVKVTPTGRLEGLLPEFFRPEVLADKMLNTVVVHGKYTSLHITGCVINNLILVDGAQVEIQSSQVKTLSVHDEGTGLYLNYGTTIKKAMFGPGTDLRGPNDFALHSANARIRHLILEDGVGFNCIGPVRIHKTYVRPGLGDAPLWNMNKYYLHGKSTLELNTDEFAVKYLDIHHKLRDTADKLIRNIFQSDRPYTEEHPGVVEHFNLHEAKGFYDGMYMEPNLSTLCPWVVPAPMPDEIWNGPAGQKAWESVLPSLMEALEYAGVAYTPQIESDAKKYLQYGDSVDFVVTRYSLYRAVDTEDREERRRILQNEADRKKVVRVHPGQIAVVDPELERVEVIPHPARPNDESAAYVVTNDRSRRLHVEVLSNGLPVVSDAPLQEQEQAPVAAETVSEAPVAVVSEATTEAQEAPVQAPQATTQDPEREAAQEAVNAFGEAFRSGGVKGLLKSIHKQRADQIKRWGPMPLVGPWYRGRVAPATAPEDTEGPAPHSADTGPKGPEETAQAS